MDYLDDQDTENVKTMLEELNLTSDDIKTYLTGSSAKTPDYNDIDIVFETKNVYRVKKDIEDYSSLSISASFGSIEGNIMDRWLIKGKIESTDLDLIIHQEPYTKEIYDTSHTLINVL